MEVGFADSQPQSYEVVEEVVEMSLIPVAALVKEIEMEHEKLNPVPRGQSTEGFEGHRIVLDFHPVAVSSCSVFVGLMCLRFYILERVCDRRLISA